jgi:hypothetical protein
MYASLMAEIDKWLQFDGPKSSRPKLRDKAIISPLPVTRKEKAREVKTSVDYVLEMG